MTKTFTKPKLEVMLAVILPAVLTLFVIFFLVMPKVRENRVVVNDFTSCVEAGNAVMESYPRQCRYGDQVFVEDVGSELSEAEAVEIARSAEECLTVGELSDQVVYNSFSRTWWIDIVEKPQMKKDSCNPACVIFEENKMGEVNWRCAGLIE